VQPAAVAVDQRVPAGAAERPAADRTGQVAERPRRDDREQGRPIVAGDGAGRQRAPEEHDHFTPRRQDGVDGHQQEDGEQAVVGDPVGQMRGHATASVPPLT